METSHKTFWDIFADEHLLDAFRIYLEKRHCEENLVFWMDAQGFKLTPTSLEETLGKQAEKLFLKYFENGAQYALNIDSGHKKRLRGALGQPSRSMFSEVQRACLRLMQNDSVPKFLLSSEFRALESGQALNKKEKKQRKKAEKSQIRLVQQLQQKADDQERAETSLLAQVQTQTEDIVEFKDLPVQDVLDQIEKLGETCQGQPWLSQGAAAIAVAANAAGHAAQQKIPDTNTSSNIRSATKTGRWASEVESIATSLALADSRRLVGQLLLLGRKWFSWPSAALAAIELAVHEMWKREEGLEADGFGTMEATPVVCFSAGDCVKQAHFLQYLDCLRRLLDQFPTAFEFSPAFIDLISVLGCSSLPGVDESTLKTANGESLVVPEAKSVTELVVFFNEHQLTFRNSAYEPPELQEFEELLLLPACSTSDQYDWNSTFEEWRLSSANYLLDECIRVEAQRKKVVTYMRSASLVIEDILLAGKVLREFLMSVEALNVSEEAVKAAGSKKKGDKVKAKRKLNDSRM